VIASHSLARYIDKKERILLACTLLLSFGLVFFGARSNIASIYINILLCYLIRLRAKVSLLKLASMISVILLTGLYLGNVRSGQYSLGDFFAFLAVALLYGNNFSDLRDFAWVDALWNHQLWMGKTYLAALTAFVPRFASEFRDTWGTGAATATTLGLDPHVHPGVRPGSFGESYFNFGLLGVIVVGFAIGVIWRRVDIDVKLAMTGPRPSMRKAFASTLLLGVAGVVAISANSSGFFVLGGIYLFSWLCLSALRLVQPHYISLVNTG
jgi:oligosaccharide repeat unit polymerase